MSVPATGSRDSGAGKRPKCFGQSAFWVLPFTEALSNPQVLPPLLPLPAARCVAWPAPAAQRGHPLPPAFPGRWTMDKSSIEAHEGRRRVAIENVQPSLDCGRFPIKRTVGETVTVTADVFADGHDVVSA